MSRPERFTNAQLEWDPFVEPAEYDELDERQIAALVQPQRAASPYFRLLADDPGILEARTRADLDIFHSRSGLPRGERELAATVVSRLNGCVYCASVHARFAEHFTRRGDDVQRLLDEGVTASFDQRWDAEVAAAVALTETPVAFGAEQVRALFDAGLDEAEVVDLVQAAAFFNWANRLMLGLGEPVAPGEPVAQGEGEDA